MNYELEINGYNALSAWGVTLGDGSVSALMTPPPMKDYITNESAATHGKIIANSPAAMPKVDSRDVQLTIYIHARKAEDTVSGGSVIERGFYTRYAEFVAELQKGQIILRTRYQENVYYRLYYVSCSQFSQFNGRMGKFTLRLTEPNPMDRNPIIEDADD